MNYELDFTSALFKIE